MTRIKFLILILISIKGFSQVPSVQWKKTFGGASLDQARCILQTIDGGYIFVGITDSLEGDVIGHHGSSSGDLWVIKIDNSGNLQWQKCLGGSSLDDAKSIVKTTDGGYIIAGNTNSTDGDVVLGTHGYLDYWIVKINSIGDIQWQKTYGGTQDDYVSNIQQTSDGGYIVIGTTQSTNGDVIGNHISNSSFSDCWIIKLSSSGILQWQKCLGSTYLDYGENIKQTSDGGYIVAGYVNYANGDVTFCNGGGDVWIVKLNNNGSIVWQKTYGGTSSDIAHNIIQTSDGGYIFSGATDSNNIDVTNNHGNRDWWVVKLNSAGIIQWQKALGSSGNDESYCIQQTSDGGFIIGGKAQKNDNDVTGHNLTPYDDYWIVKLNNSGNIQWQKSLGGTYYESVYSVQQTVDQGFIVLGTTSSSDGDVVGNHGDYDIWIVKMASELLIDSFNENDLFSIYPNPVKDILYTQLKDVKKIKIVDLSGKNTLSNENSNFINVSNLQKGMYIVQIEIEEKIYNEKFIKE